MAWTVGPCTGINNQCFFQYHIGFFIYSVIQHRVKLISPPSLFVSDVNRSVYLLKMDSLCLTILLLLVTTLGVPDPERLLRQIAVPTIVELQAVQG